jgi:hypothetical protein
MLPVGGDETGDQVARFLGVFLTTERFLYESVCLLFLILFLRQYFNIMDSRI